MQETRPGAVPFSITWNHLFKSKALTPRFAGNRLINARGETVADKPAFRRAFAQRRCLIPADGFYEWKAGPAGKEPWYITLNNRPVFAFAGLWERWKNPEGEEVLSCAIITIAANDFMKPIHHRMPVILPAGAESRWLDPALKDRAALEALLKPYPSNLMQAHAVARTSTHRGTTPSSAYCRWNDVTTQSLHRDCAS